MDRRTQNNHHALESKTPWNFNDKTSFGRRLTEDIECEICVVGGGIAGLITAYMLGREHKNVCVIEDSTLGAGDSGRTTAQVAIPLDTHFHELEKVHGLETTQKILHGQLEALNWIEEMIIDEGIDCDLTEVNGYLFAANPTEQDSINKEFETLQRLNFREAQIKASAPLPFPTGPSLMYPNQIQLHPMKFIHGLAQAIEHQGTAIYTHTHISEFKTGDVQFLRSSEGHWIRCSSLVVATHTPINDRFIVHTKQQAIRTYVISFEVPRGTIPQGFYWDTEEPFHYVRLIPSLEEGPGAMDLLLVGGEDHPTGRHDRPQVCYEALIEWTRERFPMVRNLTHKWSGQIMQSIDGLPFLGRNPVDSKKVYVMTGDSGSGWTSSALGAKIITDFVCDRQNPWQKIYDPSRFRVRTLPEYLRRGLTDLSQYLHWLDPQWVESAQRIPRGEGALLGEGLNKIAAYRDLDSHLILKSARCPHLGGVVQWNPVEKSWDCPLHGSRFNPSGHGISGPTLEGLADCPFATKKKDPDEKPFTHFTNEGRPHD